MVGGFEVLLRGRVLIYPSLLADISADEHITLDLRYGISPSFLLLLVSGDADFVFCNSRGTRFTLSRDELLTLPEFVLLSLFPNGLLPDGHMGSFHEGDVYPIDVSDTI